MNDQRALDFLLITLGIAALLLASSFLVAVVNLGTQIATLWLSLIVQGAIAILAIGIALIIVGKLFKWVFSEIVLLHRQYEELLRALKKRTPWFVFPILLVSQAVLAIADKSFQGQELPTELMVTPFPLPYKANTRFSHGGSDDSLSSNYRIPIGRLAWVMCKSKGLSFNL
jgi:hypothetical protein